MAGDKYNIRVSSWYKTNGTTPGTPVSILTDLVNALTTNVGGMTAAHGGATASQLQSSGVFIPGATNFLNSQANETTKPKAYLNWILFDAQFKMVVSGSGAEQVGDDQEFKVYVKNNMPVAKNGYLYVYVSNETPNINVFFDNLQVTHIHGQLLQEQSYYPFGLEMAGISDKALEKLDSKNKFNGGVEIEEDYGVNLYSTFYRQYDPQIGRFSGVDCQSEASMGMSVYQFGANNPISLNDPLGDRYKDNNGNVWHHADPFADIAGLAGTPYQEGNGWDGFGGSGGGGGGGGGGSYGSGGDYSGFWNNLLNQVNNGEDLSGFDKGRSQFYYQYGNQSGSGVFITPNNDGVTTYAAGEDYHLVGGVTETSYTFSGDINFQLGGMGLDFMGSDLHFGNNNIVPFSFSSDVNYTISKMDLGFISSSSYAGYHVATPNEMGLVSFNTVHNDGHISSQSITLLNTVSLTGNVDNFSLTIGFNLAGVGELHFGPTLLGGWTLGASHSNEYGQAGGDATISVGGLLLAPIRSIISR